MPGYQGSEVSRSLDGDYKLETPKLKFKRAFVNDVVGDQSTSCM